MVSTVGHVLGHVLLAILFCPETRSSTGPDEGTHWSAVPPSAARAAPLLVRGPVTAPSLDREPLPQQSV